MAGSRRIWALPDQDLGSHGHPDFRECAPSPAVRPAQRSENMTDREGMDAAANPRPDSPQDPFQNEVGPDYHQGYDGFGVRGSLAR
jgi:hypothetical protein